MKILVDLDDEANKILSLFKSAKRIKNKATAINSLIKEVKDYVRTQIDTEMSKTS